MKILGLDPGTATTGYGIINVKCQVSNVKTKRAKIKLVDYGTIETPANSYLPKRLRTIYLETRKVIKKHKPKRAAIEDLFFFKNKKTVISVAQAQGVAKMACESLKVPVKTLAPLQVKNILCQNGRACKKEVQQKVKKMLKLKEIPKPDDAADALAAAICLTKKL